VPNRSGAIFAELMAEVMKWAPKFPGHDLYFMWRNQNAPAPKGTECATTFDEVLARLQQNSAIDWGRDAWAKKVLDEEGIAV